MSALRPNGTQEWWWREGGRENAKYVCGGILAFLRRLWAAGILNLRCIRSNLLRVLALTDFAILIPMVQMLASSFLFRYM
jgi:hypothetical protein